MAPAAVAAVLALAAVEAEDTWVVTLLRVANARDSVRRITRLVVDVVFALALKLCRKERTCVICYSKSCVCKHRDVVFCMKPNILNSYMT